MMFNKYLDDCRQKIDTALEGIFSEWEQDIARTSPHVSNLFKAFKDQSTGGKRIRGTLMYCMNDNKSKDSDIVQIACAYEIFQTAILIHDDIIDKSQMRRNKPSLYQQLGGDHYAISQSICLGDLGIIMSSKLIAMSNFPNSIVKRAMGFFETIKQETTQGEMLDIWLTRQKQYSLDDLILVAKLKTALYTFSGPLRLGAILRDENDTVLEKIHAFGVELGIAFQIQDDIQGIFGKEEVIGKSTTSDISEGKATILIWYARNNATPTELKHIQSIYGKPNCTPKDRELLKDLFFTTGALEYAKKNVSEYLTRARNMLPLIVINKKQDDLFTDMIEYLYERNH